MKSEIKVEDEKTFQPKKQKIQDFNIAIKDTEEKDHLQTS